MPSPQPHTATPARSASVRLTLASGSPHHTGAAPAPLERLLDGDYSDPDVILVDGTYWMITSTIHVSPGIAVLRSTDMLAWEHVGHVVPDLTVLGPAYAPDRMGSRFGRGVYAGSLRYHGGLFWVHFTTLDEGVFVCTAADPTGSWSTPHRLSDATMWDDPCPWWDDDGQAWLALSNPGPQEWFTYLVPMSPDGRTLHLDDRRVVDDWHTSEGNKLYRRGDWYYLLHNESHGPGDRLAVVLRTRRLDGGSWEKRVLVRGTGLDRSREPNQGALLADTAGGWWFVTHHGRTGYPEGRPLSRLPIGWQDDWPVVLGPDGPTESAVLRESPVLGTVGPRDDDFAAGLGPQWEWANVPPPGSWSVPADPPRLRLRPAAPVAGAGLRTLATVLTQRTASRPGSASVQLDGVGLADGEVAGLAHSSTTGAVGIGLQRDGDGFRLVLVQEEVRELVRVPGPRVELRTDVDARSWASFGFRSTPDRESQPDGELRPDEEFQPVGDSYPLVSADYRGSRLALFALRPSDDEAEGRGFAEFTNFQYAVGEDERWSR